MYHHLLGDTESQRKVFEEMKQNKAAPNEQTYSEMMKAYLYK